MSHKFSLEIKIPNVISFVDEMERFSTHVIHQNLDWYGEARALKPSKSSIVVDDKIYLSCFVYCRPTASEAKNWKCKVDFKMNLINLNANQTDAYRILGSQTFDPFTSPSWGFSKFMDYDDFVLRYSKDNMGLIRIEVEAGIPIGLHLNEKDELSSIADQKRRDGTLSLLRSGIGSNVTFVTQDGDKKVKAHQGILMAGSPVFAAMFASGMQEAETGQVPLPDITSACIELVLQYIYGAPLSNFDNIPAHLTQQLVYASEKYELQELKKYCGHLLVERCTPSNILQLRETAKQFKLDQAVREMEGLMKANLVNFLNNFMSPTSDPSIFSD